MRTDGPAYTGRASRSHKPSPTPLQTPTPTHCSLGPTTLAAMHYLTAVQLLTAERRRRPGSLPLRFTTFGAQKIPLGL